MNENTRLWLGIAVVAVAGLAIGLLMLPEKGKSFRNSVADSLDELGSRVNSLLTESGHEDLKEQAASETKFISQNKTGRNTRAAT